MKSGLWVSHAWSRIVDAPGRDQRLDLFIKVLRVSCPNLTDATASLGTNPHYVRTRLQPPRSGYNNACLYDA